MHFTNKQTCGSLNAMGIAISKLECRLFLTAVFKRSCSQKKSGVQYEFTQINYEVPNFRALLNG